MTDVERAAAVFAVAPGAVGGVGLSVAPGRSAYGWLAFLASIDPAMAVRRMPLNISDDGLLGGVNLAATLVSGRPVYDPGFLASARGGAVLLTMADRVAAPIIAKIGAAMDCGNLGAPLEARAAPASAQFGVIAFTDELEGRSLAPILAERLGIQVLLDEVMADKPQDIDLVRARERFLRPSDESDVIAILCEACLRCGVSSLRVPSLALAVARASAALRGDNRIEDDDIAFAARVVIAPRAVRDPEITAPDLPIPPENSQDEDEGDRSDASSSENQTSAEGKAAPLDVVLAAVAAALPAKVLAGLGANAIDGARQGVAGKVGGAKLAKHRGRIIGVRAGDPRSGARLAVLDTLRRAAPWQRVRTGRPGRIAVRKEDFQVYRYRQNTETTTIFAVDASGSAAFGRLAEAKGAVELMLADCYARRDRVAMITFRGQGAELVLPPTRSLVRARRLLSGLPGGGATPLASALDAARMLAMAERRSGRVPVIVLLTDGRANVGHEGRTGRRIAEDDAILVAKEIRRDRVDCLFVDTSPRAQEFSRKLATEAGAKAFFLPYVGSSGLRDAVREATS